MGKSKNKKKLVSSRPTPLGAGAHALHDDSDDAINGDDDLLQRIHGEITSGKIIQYCKFKTRIVINYLGSKSDKECGCAKLAMIVDQRYNEILEMKMVKMAAPLMIDTSDNVRHSATGALKNMSLVSEDVCDEMVKQVSC